MRGALTRVLEILRRVFGTSEVEWLRSRVVELEKALLTMKEKGFSYEPEIPYTPPALVDERVMDAIRVRSGGNERLAANLLAYAQSELSAEAPVEFVVDSIYRGGEVD